MRTSTNRVVVGLDNGGNVNNATVLETTGRFLVDGLIESPSLVREGPDIAIDAVVRTFDDVLALTGTAKAAVLAIGLDWLVIGEQSRHVSGLVHGQGP